MPVCGCGRQLAGEPPIIDGGISDDLGIIISGTLDNTIITATAATAWRPLTTADFTTINFTIGNGSFNARYLYDGYNVDCIFSIRFGSTSTFGGTQWGLDLPWTPQAMTGVINNHGVLGTWSAFDSSAGTPWYQGTMVVDATGFFRFRFGDDVGAFNAFLLQGTPFAFAAGDELSMKVRFEATTN